MIVFQNNDKKVESLIKELKYHSIEGIGLKVKHPVLTPLYLLRLLIGKRKIKVFVFRYLNDSNNFLLAVVRYLSDLSIILISKIWNIEIWYLCHNIDRETIMYYPKITTFRRLSISKNSRVIFTTNQLLIPKAKLMFPHNLIDCISLGYIEGGPLKDTVNRDVEQVISNWIDSRESSTSRFIFCIGSPAGKSLHFKLVSRFIRKLNESSKFKWYGVVIGCGIEDNPDILNIPYRCVLSKNFIKEHADFYYRVIDDFSMSYSTYEAVNYHIPTITEDYGILPELISKYKIVVVVNSIKADFENLENFKLQDMDFFSFQKENNWKVAADKLKKYYETIGFGDPSISPKRKSI